MNAEQRQYITIYTEANPNPNSLKFVLNHMLVGEGQTFDFPDAQSAQNNSPLALALFEFPYVKRVFIMSNFITVTKGDAESWHDIAPIIKKFIKEYLEEGKLLLSKEALAEYHMDEPGGDVSELDRKIISILDEYVKPAVESDGGAINFHSFDQGTVKVLLQGSCSGCPSSTLTLKQGIENLLTSMVPEVKEVVAEGI